VEQQQEVIMEEEVVVVIGMEVVEVVVGPIQAPVELDVFF
jgi:hypothetical protein